VSRRTDDPPIPSGPRLHFSHSRHIVRPSVRRSLLRGLVKFLTPFEMICPRDRPSLVSSSGRKTVFPFREDRGRRWTPLPIFSVNPGNTPSFSPAGLGLIRLWCFSKIVHTEPLFQWAPHLPQWFRALRLDVIDAPFFEVVWESLGYQQSLSDRSIPLFFPAFALIYESS